MYTAPVTALAPAQIERSSTLVHGPIGIQTGFAINAKLVSQTLIAAARNRAGFVTPRPCAPTAFYTNPDGTVCTNRKECLAFDRQGFHS